MCIRVATRYRASMKINKWTVRDENTIEGAVPLSISVEVLCSVFLNESEN